MSEGIGRLKHISQNGHKRAPDGNVYAYTTDGTVNGKAWVVVQPHGERWGVWRTLEPEQPGEQPEP